MGQALFSSYEVNRDIDFGIINFFPLSLQARENFTALFEIYFIFHLLHGCKKLDILN